ncbi:PepSY domain-containing protein [Sphingomonas melonis]|uniref:Peptidase n=1 Tax=Sphingomonas melonis TaxID=152682 RepID=A0A7Y9FQ13_9SPHN|nr:PepSY domain-containing protein [Sphingomonas melonis]NYD91319.1 hypothetical protein [Sphingomonas melonis]
MPASDVRRRQRLLPALAWVHRWLGVATCLIFAAWFASGAIMLFQPFPALSHAAQMGLQAPIDGERIAIPPRQALGNAGGEAETLRLVQRAGHPTYLVGTASIVQAVDAMTGATRPLLSRQEAGDEARRVVGPGATVVGPFDYDQWVVHNHFDPARPFYRLDANDAVGTQLYLSAQTGEVLQRTTRAARAWNWAGAVLHWVYVTPLRKSWIAWDRSLWWLSLVCMLVAVTGTILGIVRMLAARRLHPPAITFYRQRWLRWHHLLGLGTAVFVLGWIVSGWLSMDHGRLFSRGTATARQAARYAGCPLAMALGPDAPVRTMTRDARALVFTPVACRVVATRYAAGGGTTRFDSAGQQIGAADMHRLVQQAATAGWPAPSRVRIGPVDPSATYALAEGWSGSAWRVRLGATSLPDLYVDADTGQLLTVMDASRAAYAWIYYALHTGNVPGLTTRPALRRGLLLIPLTAGFLFSITGVVLGWRRIRRAAYRR